MIADARDKIPGNRRRRTLGYVVIELFEFGFRFRMEDDPVYHPLPGFRLPPAMTGLQPGKHRFGGDCLCRILPELGHA